MTGPNEERSDRPVEPAPSEVSGEGSSVLSGEGAVPPPEDPSTLVVPSPEAERAADPVQDFLAHLPEGAFSEVCSLLNCPRGEVEAAIRSSRVDVKDAFGLLRALAPSCLAVKGRFAARKRGELNGVFCIVADGITGEIMDMTLWVGSVEIPGGVDLGASWESVRSSLREIVAAPDKSAYRLSESILHQHFSPTSINLLFRGSDSSQREKNSALKEALSNAFRVDLVCDLEMERFHRVRIDLSPLGRKLEAVQSEVPSEEKVKEDPLRLSDVRIPCRPHLDPVRGRPVSRLRPGDRIPVTLDETSGLGRLMARIYQKGGREAVFPVESVERQSSGDILVRIAISEGVHGLIKVSGEVRVRLASDEPRRSGVDAGIPLPLVLGFVGLGLVVVLFVYFILR